MTRPVLVLGHRAERKRHHSHWTAAAFATRDDLPVDFMIPRAEHPLISLKGLSPYNGSASVYIVGPTFCATGGT